jgi:hypothetical protein
VEKKKSRKPENHRPCEKGSPPAHILYRIHKDMNAFIPPDGLDKGKLGGECTQGLFFIPIRAKR